MRRRARETALQVLYQLDVQPELDVGLALARFQSSFQVQGVAPQEAESESGEAVLPGESGSEGERDDETWRFAERLVRGVMEHLAAVDARIVRASRNWRLERMARVDRNLLRLAAYEICFCRDIPPKVAINEAIEIAKRFGAHETPAFVNGILDRVLDELP